MILFVEKKGTEYFYADVEENGDRAGLQIPRESFRALSESGFVQFQKLSETVFKRKKKRKFVNRNPRG